MRLFSERCGMGNEEEPHACIQLFTRLNRNLMLPQVTYVKCRQTSVAKRPRKCYIPKRCRMVRPTLFLLSLKTVCSLFSQGHLSEEQVDGLFDSSFVPS